MLFLAEFKVKDKLLVFARFNFRLFVGLMDDLDGRNLEGIYSI